MSLSAGVLSVVPIPYCYLLLFITAFLHLFDDILDRSLVRTAWRIGEPDSPQSSHRFVYAHLLNFVQDEAALFTLRTVWNAKDFCKFCDRISQFELLSRHRERLFPVIPSRCRSTGAPQRHSSAAILAFFPPLPCWLRGRVPRQAGE